MRDGIASFSRGWQGLFQHLGLWNSGPPVCETAGHPTVTLVQFSNYVSTKYADGISRCRIDPRKLPLNVTFFLLFAQYLARGWMLESSRCRDWSSISCSTTVKLGWLMCLVLTPDILSKDGASIQFGCNLRRCILSWHRRSLWRLPDCKILSDAMLPVWVTSVRQVLVDVSVTQWGGCYRYLIFKTVFVPHFG